jgi:hypothetical protein
MRWEVARWFVAGGIAAVVLLVSATSLADMLGGLGDTIEESGRNDAVSAHLDDLAEDPMMASAPPGAELLNETRREDCDDSGPLSTSITRTLEGVTIDELVLYLGLTAGEEGWRAAPLNTTEEDLGADTVFSRRFPGRWTARVAVYSTPDGAVAVAGYISEPRPCPLTSGSIG